MNKTDWLLFVIAAGSYDGLTPVQLQKVLFLLGDKCGALVGEDFYQFVPYDYGPFDVAVCDDAQELERQGCVTIHPEPGNRYSTYKITEKGVDVVVDLLPQAHSFAVHYLQSLVDWAKTLTFSELVAAIFKAYPGMAENAVFQCN